MKFLLVLPCLLLTSISYGQTAAPADENKLPVAVVSASWLRDRRSSDNAVSAAVAPAAAPTKADKNFERQKRINDPVGYRDPNADTLDTRGSKLDRIGQQSRQRPPADGYTYLLTNQNLSPQGNQHLVWAK